MVASVLEHAQWACRSPSQRSGCLNCIRALQEAPSSAQHESYESLCPMGSSTGEGNENCDSQKIEEEPQRMHMGQSVSTSQAKTETLPLLVILSIQSFRMVCLVFAHIHSRILHLFLIPSFKFLI